MTRWIVLASLLCASSCAPATTPKTALKKEWLFLLPVKIQPEMDEENAKLMSLLSRGIAVRAFDEKDIPIISPVQMQITERDLHVNLAEDGGWTMDLYNKLWDRWTMRYLSTLTVVEMSSKEGLVSVPPGSPPPPGGTLTTTVRVVGSLYDFKQRKYIFENKESKVELKTGRPGPMDQQITDERNKALMQAIRSLYKPFLSKLPNKPPSVGINAGGGGGK